MKQLIKILILLIIAGIIIFKIIQGFLQATTPQPVVLQGQMEAQEINVASKISGRVDRKRPNQKGNAHFAY